MQRRDLIRQLFFRRSSAKTLIFEKAEEKNLKSAEIADGPDQFHSTWHLLQDMHGIGRDFWVEVARDFCIKNGGLQCIAHAADRTVHLLTHQYTSETRSFAADMIFKFLNDPDEVNNRANIAGFRLGNKVSYNDDHSAVITEKGIDAGITRSGHLFIGDVFSVIKICETTLINKIRLALVITLQTTGTHFAKLKALDYSGNTVATINTSKYGATDWEGNIALMSNFRSSDENSRQPTISVAKFIVKGDHLRYELR